ncbi:MAG: wax ester/triacylglycerol synthase family O-acyltransferase, partial [Pseudomonadales bacterium]
PYWVLDENFDVEFHMRHIALPHPGDWRQLCIQVARLHARPLDMSRPLWEAYIIEGLDKIPDVPKGAFAIYTKMHHSLVDGAGGQAFMTALHDLVPDPEPDDRAASDALVIDREPTHAELLVKAMVNRTKNTFSLTKGIAGRAIDLAKYGISVVRDEIPSPDMQAPKTRFNNPVGPHRVADAAVFDLDDFKALKNAAGVTMNDVALSVVGGALRKYLQHCNELPEESLAAGIPMNMRTRRAHTDENNQVGSMFTSLHTDIEDPVARLHAVHDSAVDAKASNESNPMVDALKIAGVFSPVVSKTVAGIWARNQLSRFIPLNISTVISNVPGPNFPLYSAGAQMVRYHGLGLLTPGCGVFHLVFSCNGVVTVTVLADRDIIPDPEFYRQCLVASFKETEKAVLGKVQPKKVTTKKVKAKPAVKAKVKKTPAKKAAAKKIAVKKAPVKKAAAKTRQAGVPVKRATAAKTKRKKSRARSTAAV